MSMFSLTPTTPDPLTLGFTELIPSLKRWVRNAQGDVDTLLLWYRVVSKKDKGTGREPSPVVELVRLLGRTGLLLSRSCQVQGSVLPGTGPILADMLSKGKLEEFNELHHRVGGDGLFRH